MTGSALIQRSDFKQRLIVDDLQLSWNVFYSD
jgi:hypothetical protein